MKPSFDETKAGVPGWWPHTIRPVRAAGGVAWHRSLWLPEGTQAYSRDAAVVSIEVAETASADEAGRVALQLANECEIPALEHSEMVGDRAYTGPGGVPAIFTRGRFAVCVMQAERAGVPVLDVARALDTHLAGLAAGA